MSELADIVLYESKGSPRSLWNDYRIYRDRIELQARMALTTFVIRKDDLVAIDVYRPPVLITAPFALKLDLADLFKHVGIRRRSGLFKQLRFTPSDPHEFVRRAKAWAAQ